MISIVIIVKNDKRVETLLRKLESIKKPVPAEVVVVDASRGSLDYIKERFPKVRWVYFQHKTGKKFTYAEQRNVGIKSAQGDIVVFIDADCMPENDWLVELTTPIMKDGENAVGGKIISTRKFPKRWDDYYKRIAKAEYFEAAPGGNFAFKKSVIDKVGLYDENFFVGGCEDDDFSWRLSQNGFRVKYVANAKVYHDWGNLATNIKRVLAYGDRRFYLYLKYPAKVLETDNATILIYAGYIALLPVSLFLPVYPLLIVVPLAKNICEKIPAINALDSVFFNLITSVGFIRGFCRFLIKR